MPGQQVEARPFLLAPDIETARHPRFPLPSESGSGPSQFAAVAARLRPHSCGGHGGWRLCRPPRGRLEDRFVQRRPLQPSPLPLPSVALGDFDL
jgi:hypothetical protein